MMVHEYPRATSFNKTDKIPVNHGDFTVTITIENFANEIAKRLREDENK